jgi:hypothetical protein
MSIITLKDKTGQVSQQVEITPDSEGARAALTSLIKEAADLGVIARVVSYGVENTANGFVNSITVGLDDGTGTPAYMKRYVALLTQSGGDDPVAVVLENDLGTITWTRISTGIYEGLLSGGNLFVADKTFMTRVLDCSTATLIEIISERVNTTTVRIRSKQSINEISNETDGLFTDLPIEIRVYN